MTSPEPTPDALLAAYALVQRLAAMTTPEEEFEARKGDDGMVHDDGIAYEDADEMSAEWSDDRLMDEVAAFMDSVRAAKAIVARAVKP